MSNKDLINAQVAWEIKLKEYNRKLNSALSVAESEENDLDLCKLRISYNYCIEKLTSIVNAYQYLIELRNDGALTESFLKTQLYLISKNQKAFWEEAKKDGISDLEKTYINKPSTTTIM